jgi:hypothetical protein
MDESHVHVRASSTEDARVRALDLVASVYKREQLARVNLG